METVVDILGASGAASRIRHLEGAGSLDKGTAQNVGPRCG